VVFLQMFLMVQNNKRRGVLRYKYIASGVLIIMILLILQVSDARAEGRILKTGLSGEDVSALQTTLCSLGYLMPGKADGIFGSLTMSAVVELQRKHGLSCDGIVGPATLAAMNEELAIKKPQTKGTQPEALKKGMRGDRVLNLQKKLTTLGYYQGSLDGIFGSGTLLAVIEFQTTNGLNADGVAGHQTLGMLNGSPIGASRGATGDRRSQAIASFAKQFLGTPYAWGGNTPGGFDCSGFTSYVYKNFGIQVPRTADEQFYCGTRVSQLIPGDMVFFTTYEPGPSHAGIYIGDNNFIHSSSAAGGVIITSLSKNYYSERYLGACRLIN